MFETMLCQQHFWDLLVHFVASGNEFFLNVIFVSLI